MKPQDIKPDPAHGVCPISFFINNYLFILAKVYCGTNSVLCNINKYLLNMVFTDTIIRNVSAAAPTMFKQASTVMKVQINDNYLYKMLLNYMLQCACPIKLKKSLSILMS